MKNFIKGIKYWGQLLLLPVYWISFFVPKNKRLWLFGSTFGRRFADNPKYLYLYINQWKRETIRAVWISHDKKIINFLNDNGYEAYYYLALKGIWYCFRGSVYIFDNYSKDINFWTSGGAIKVNLWHGVGNKKINYDNKYDEVRHPKTIWQRFISFPRRLSDEKPSHYVLATSPLMATIFSRAFRIPNSHILIGGYPRNDVLFKECKITSILTSEEKTLLRNIKNKKENGKRVVGYFPTFRNTEIALLKVMDFEKLHMFLKTQQMIFIIKLHPKSMLNDKLKEIPFSTIQIIPSDIDINIFLNEVDVLVTDYSSIYSDYMLLDRPAIAFQYDYDSYRTETRDAYFKFEEYMPEQRAVTMEELMESLKKVIEKDERKALRKKSRDLIFEKQSAGACREVTRHILELLKS